MTTMFPKIEKAMIPDTTRGAKSLPKTSLKNTVAMSRLSYSCSFTETTQSYGDVSVRMMFPMGGQGTNAMLTRILMMEMKMTATMVVLAKFFFGR